MWDALWFAGMGGGGITVLAGELSMEVSSATLEMDIADNLEMHIHDDLSADIVSDVSMQIEGDIEADTC